jgi:hypothetical protein
MYRLQSALASGGRCPHWCGNRFVVDHLALGEMFHASHGEITPWNVFVGGTETVSAGLVP